MSQAMKSRAELDKEPRLFAFVVERGCPEQSSSTPTKVKLPVIVWVDLGRKVNLNSPYSCSAKQYLVPNEHARELRRRDGKPITDWDHRVCEHMGYLIE